MLIGSLLLHLIALFLLFWSQPEREPGPPNPDTSDQLSMVFESPKASQASTQSANPSTQPQLAAGNQNAPVAPPQPDSSAPATPPPGPVAPTPPAPQPAPPTPAPEPTPQPVSEPAPPVPAPPQPQPPQQTQQQTPQPPPQVSLDQEEEPALQPPPPFVMPQPPPPLPPPLPRPVAPPRLAQPNPRSPSGFPLPQDWSFNSTSRQAPGRSAHGFDLSVNPQGGPTDDAMGYIAGARPSGDWMSALRKWVDLHKYYPEAAVEQLQQGDVAIAVEIDRSGKVLGVQMIRTSGSAFLDGAWLDVFRGATVPAFSPDMTEQTTTLRATIHFILRIHR